MSMRVFIYPAQRFSTMATRLRNMMMPVRFLNGIKSQIRCRACDAHDFLSSLFDPFDSRLWLEVGSSDFWLTLTQPIAGGGTR